MLYSAVYWPNSMENCLFKIYFREKKKLSFSSDLFLSYQNQNKVQYVFFSIGPKIKDVTILAADHFVAYDEKAEIN